MREKSSFMRVLFVFVVRIVYLLIYFLSLASQFVLKGHDFPLDHRDLTKLILHSMWESTISLQQHTNIQIFCDILK